MHRHFITNKPYKCLSQFINTKTRKKIVLGDLFPFPEGTMAIGRLDAKTEGLLMLTTDGKVSQAVRSKKIEKEYYAQVDGIITDEAILKLKTGVEISVDSQPYTTLPCKAFKIDIEPDLPVEERKVRDERHGPKSWVSITVTEGKFKQVRKMTAAVGFPTLRLVRVRIDKVLLNNLQPGEVIELDSLL